MVLGMQCLCAFAVHTVEMGIARDRALKHIISIAFSIVIIVEMGIARDRALKHCWQIWNSLILVL